MSLYLPVPLSLTFTTLYFSHGRLRSRKAMTTSKVSVHVYLKIQVVDVAVQYTASRETQMNYHDE